VSSERLRLWLSKWNDLGFGIFYIRTGLAMGSGWVHISPSRTCVLKSGKTQIQSKRGKPVKLDFVRVGTADMSVIVMPRRNEEKWGRSNGSQSATTPHRDKILDLKGGKKEKVFGSAKCSAVHKKRGSA